MSCGLMLVAVAAAALAVWYWFVRPLGFWQRRGVPYEPALPFFGNFWKVLLQKINAGELIADIYRKYEGQPYVGIYQFTQPSLLLRDPELVRSVLTKDFMHFRENIFPVDPDLDPLLAKNPFVLTGEKWKKSRSQMTPAFSSGRIRNMLPLLKECGDKMVAFVTREAPGNLPDGMDAKELAARYTTEAVSSVAFALKANCFEDPNPEVRRMNRQILEPTGFRTLQLTLNFFLPKLAHILKIRMMPLEVDKYFRALVRDAIDYREKTGFERADFLQMLLQLKKKSLEAGDGAYEEDDMTAHALSFFVDGFETSSVALSCLLHDLAWTPDSQRRLREELRSLPAGDLEAVLHAPFLDACLQETLRLHPPGTFLQKKCTEAWRPSSAPEGSQPLLRPGESVILPLLALHTDEALHPRALEYRPQRWLPGETDAPAPKQWTLPFGDGPRQCLGMRFALAQVKMGAATLVRNFEIRTTPRSPPNPPPIDPISFLYAAKGGMWVHFEPIAK